MLFSVQVPSQIGWLAFTATLESATQILVLDLVAGHRPVVVGWLQVDHVDHTLFTTQLQHHMAFFKIFSMT